MIVVVVVVVGSDRLGFCVKRVESCLKVAFKSGQVSLSLACVSHRLKSSLQTIEV